MTLLDDFRQFVIDAEAGNQYAQWARQNPGELARWQAFRDAIVTGQRPVPPPMLTPHGRELVDAGKLYLNATAPSPPALHVAISGSARQGSKLTAAIQ